MNDIKISIYDPFRNAFCKVPITQAEKLLDEVENIKEAIKKVKGVENESNK